VVHDGLSATPEKLLSPNERTWRGTLVPAHQSFLSPVAYRLTYPTATEGDPSAVIGNAVGTFIG